MWIILNDRASTWDILQKMTFVGLGWCSLCQQVEETNAHIIITCPFIKEVWKEVEIMMGYSNFKVGDKIEEAFKI
jgi:hypothetical protein